MRGVNLSNKIVETKGVEMKSENLNTIKSNTTERNLVINGTCIRIRSVFIGKITLEKALENIAKRKLMNLQNKNKQ